MVTEVYVQARMRSTRLPGKVLKPVLGRPMLYYLIERLRQAKEIDEVVVLTSQHKADDEIVAFCQQHRIDCFRGSEENVLERYYQAALQRQPDLIVRVTGDCPLIDPVILDQTIQLFKQNQPHIDYVSNTLELTFPRGLDVEIFSFTVLKQVRQEAKKLEEQEHVTPYIYWNPQLFRLANFKHSSSLAFHRWTVDTAEDFKLIRLILENLYPQNPYFRLQDVLNLLDKHPEWLAINQKIMQKKLFQ
jgi:spore coat polysaccharide biosynthesis protein SpsF